MRFSLKTTQSEHDGLLNARGNEDRTQNESGKSRSKKKSIIVKKQSIDDDLLKNSKDNSVAKPSISALVFESRRSRKIKHERKREVDEDKTLRGEERFLDRIERYKDRRVQRICVCKVTKWLLFKERLSLLAEKFSLCGRGCYVFCCPPLCRTLQTIAFWPPPCAYFFYREPEGIKSISEDEMEQIGEAEYWRRRKEKFIRLKKMNRSATTGEWLIGMEHSCSPEVKGIKGFVIKTKRKQYIACVKARYPNGSERFSILYSHPNATDLSDHVIGVPNLMDMARFYHCDVYAYDYSGYGISSGIATEKNQNADIRALYDYMVNELSIESSRILIIGYSIGTCASINLLSTIHNKVAGVVLQAPPTSILRVLLWGRGCIEQPYKIESSCIDHFSSFDRIGEVRVPILVIHGYNDDVVPISHGRTLLQKSRSCVPPLFIEATHGNLENQKIVWKRIRQFIKSELSKNLDKEIHCKNNV